MAHGTHCPLWLGPTLDFCSGRSFQAVAAAQMGRGAEPQEGNQGLSFKDLVSHTGEGNGSSLQCSCLENPKLNKQTLRSTQSYQIICILTEFGLPWWLRW